MEVDPSEGIELGSTETGLSWFFQERSVSCVSSFLLLQWIKWQLVCPVRS